MRCSVDPTVPPCDDSFRGIVKGVTVKALKPPDSETTVEASFPKPCLRSMATRLLRGSCVVAYYYHYYSYY